MAELKTQKTDQPVADFLNHIVDSTTRTTCIELCKIMEDTTKETAKMWGTSIVGVGRKVVTYSNGKTLDWFNMGFSPRKANISLYILGCGDEEKAALLERIGNHKTGKGCIYIKSLADINIEVLRELCELSFRNSKS